MLKHGWNWDSEVCTYAAGNGQLAHAATGLPAWLCPEMACVLPCSMGATWLYCNGPVCPPFQPAHLPCGHPRQPPLNINQHQAHRESNMYGCLVAGKLESQVTLEKGSWAASVRCLTGQCPRLDLTAHDLMQLAA